MLRHLLFGFMGLCLIACQSSEDGQLPAEVAGLNHAGSLRVKAEVVRLSGVDYERMSALSSAEKESLISPTEWLECRGLVYGPDGIEDSSDLDLEISVGTVYDREPSQLSSSLVDGKYFDQEIPTTLICLVNLYDADGKIVSSDRVKIEGIRQAP